MTTPVAGPRRWKQIAARGALLLGVAYGLLMIPETSPPPPEGAGKEVFLWNRDAFWSALEARYLQARVLDQGERAARFNQALDQFEHALLPLGETNVPPQSPPLRELENAFFELAPLAATQPQRLPDLLGAAERMRTLVKRQSENWPLDSTAARQQIYRLLYGSRAAVEEVLLQSPPATDSPNRTNLFALLETAATGATLRSGDILVSRGGAATSALIARGNDFPGNFSHIALAHVDEQTKQVSVIEAHIESGVGVRSLAAYLAEIKLRVMVLRLRPNLPALITDPGLPHQAATLALSNALARHIPYDFAMDGNDPTKQFCSEVAAAAYRAKGMTLWSCRSHLSTPGVTSWLAALGVRHFETQEPSDLEYDPQLTVVAEWRDPATLFKDHVDNAVVDAMLESAERGERLGHNRWMLPAVRLAKAWSVGLNWFGKVGPVPEGMSATTALRVDRFKKRYVAIQKRVIESAEAFRKQRGYVPPYWELVRLAREAMAALSAPP